MTSVLKKMEDRKFEKDMFELDNIRKNKGKAAEIFALKDKILGKKKITQDQVVVNDPETGLDVYTPDEIKRVSLNYLVNLLKTKEPKPEYSEIVSRKKDLHYERMEENLEDDIEELPVDSFWKTLEVIQKKPGKKYQFITSSGNSLKAALLNLFQMVWKTEIIPKSWHESTVTQLYKGRGPLSELSSMRHIQCILYIHVIFWLNFFVKLS